jgi:hypothetical protein
MLADDGNESGAVRVLDDETDADNPARRHHLYEKRTYLKKKPVMSQRIKQKHPIDIGTGCM